MSPKKFFHLHPSVVSKAKKIWWEAVEEIFEGYAMDIILDSFDGVELDFFEDATAVQI